MIKIFLQPHYSAVNIHLHMKRMVQHCNADTFTLFMHENSEWNKSYLNYYKSPKEKEAFNAKINIYTLLNLEDSNSSETMLLKKEN